MVIVACFSIRPKVSLGVEKVLLKPKIYLQTQRSNLFAEGFYAHYRGKQTIKTGLYKATRLILVL